MQQFFLLVCLLATTILEAQNAADTTTYELMLNDGRVSYVKITEVKKGEHIKVIDQNQSLYTFDWSSFKYYKPAYQKAGYQKPSDKKLPEQGRFSPNYNASAYVAKAPGKTQRNVGIVLFSIGVGILAAAIPVIATATDYHFSYYQNTNGQSYKSGDPKGGFGVVMLVPGVALSITGAALWGKGITRMRKFRKSKMAIEG